MADPMALVVADAAARAVEFVGLPEAQLNLAQAVVHLATAPKSNRAALGIWQAREDVPQRAGGEVPAAPARRPLPGRAVARPRRGVRVSSRRPPGLGAPSSTAPTRWRTAATTSPPTHGFEEEVRRADGRGRSSRRQRP